MKVTLAYYHGGNKLHHRLIRWWTSGPFSHVELFDTSTGMCWSSSSKDGGVRQKMLDLTNGNWTVIQYELPFEAEPIKWFEAHDGSPYSWNSIANYVWYLFTELETEYNCSVAIIRSLGYSIDRITPNELYYFLYPFRSKTIEYEGTHATIERHQKRVTDQIRIDNG